MEYNNEGHAWEREEVNDPRGDEIRKTKDERQDKIEDEDEDKRENQRKRPWIRSRSTLKNKESKIGNR